MNRMSRINVQNVVMFTRDIKTMVLVFLIISVTFILLDSTNQMVHFISKIDDRGFE